MVVYQLAPERDAFGACPYAYTTPATWWLWNLLDRLEPTKGDLGGTYAKKKGFHSTGKENSELWPGNYSVRDVPNRRGPWWWTYSSALDWTFRDAQAGDYTTIRKYSARLDASMRNPNDPRLDLVLFEYFGQADNDEHVEGYNEFREEAVTSDSSHLWHIHLSFLRDKCGDFDAMWALYTVLAGFSVDQWRASMEDDMPLSDDDVERIVAGVNNARFSETKDANGNYLWPRRMTMETNLWENASKRQFPDWTSAQQAAATVAYLKEIKGTLAGVVSGITAIAAEVSDLGDNAAIVQELNALEDRLNTEINEVDDEVQTAFLGGTDEQVADILSDLLGDRKESVLALMQAE